jgi:hypothetical protein
MQSFQLDLKNFHYSLCEIQLVFLFFSLFFFFFFFFFFFSVFHLTILFIANNKFI